ncbi:MAG TPA: helix-turn-helix domain-containing protein [Candidatus Acetatifactor stercoripullorum]|uniref:Helix-turn-helix domain-containing protein n=1 Tax=Candidatus Acetatifactor stercoripullorum TaxID=2838414 RepID=A0A9D1UDJ4_9FIRM|nr:helix-turn-helix domain-containing protein [Candidatus Acetatifactor stercoripullorum]
MYEIFLKLLEQKGVTAYKVGKTTGIASSTFSDWKSGRSVPKQEKLQKIADYFGVTVEYLMTGQNSKYSDADAILDVRISEDFELKEAIKKYYSLDDRKKKHVIELINLLSEE